MMFLFFLEGKGSRTLNKLSKMENNIQSLVKDGDYDEALDVNEELLSLANTLTDANDHLKWTNRYYKLHVTIESARRKESGDEPSIIKMTQPDKKFSGMTYTEAIDYLYDIGFYNVMPKQVKGSLFTSKDKVKEISINGEDDFDSGDTFPDDSEVIVYYYDR